MADLGTVVDQTTVVTTPWIQNVNDVIYRMLGASVGVGGAGPANRAAILANLSLYTQAQVDSKDAATLTSANSHADAGDATTLAAAEAYTDTQVAANAAVGGYSVRGLSGANNSGTPNTQYDFSANLAVLRKPSDNTVVVRSNTGTITCNVSTAGPAANGRDQAGAFSASSWIHFYFIWNGATLATLASATAPPTGPTLPGGYTHWAYLGAVRFDGSSHLVSTYARGARFKFADYNAQKPLNNGSATSPTSVSLANYIPPNALEALLLGSFVNVNDHAGAGSDDALLGITDSSLDHQGTFYAYGFTGAVGGSAVVQYDVSVPNVGQSVSYNISRGSSGGTAPTFTIFARGYTVPNGDS